MLINDSTRELDSYLTENHRKNRHQDFANMSKVGRHFDPLLDQEPDPDTISFDPGQPVLTENEQNVLNIHTVTIDHDKKPSLVLYNSCQDKAKASAPSEISKAKQVKAKRGKRK